MQNLLVYLKSLALLALSVLLFSLTYVILGVPKMIDVVRVDLQREVDSTRLDTLKLLDKHLTLANSALNANEGSISLALDRNMQLLNNSVDKNLNTVSSSVATSVDTLGNQASKYLLQTSETLADADQTIKDVDTIVKDQRPQVLGLSAAGKVTLGETAQTMRDVQRALPEILTTINTIGNNSAQATEKDIELHNEAIAVMQNLKKDTKPSTLVAKLAVTAAVAALHIFF